MPCDVRFRWSLVRGPALTLDVAFLMQNLSSHVGVVWMRDANIYAG